MEALQASSPPHYLPNTAKSTNALGLPFGQNWHPNERLNLFHIDNQEVHLSAVPCDFFVSA